MKNTGLGYFKDTTVDNFTSDVGLNIRKKVNPVWRKILKIATKRNVIVEQYPKLDKDKSYIFVCNHSFDEDVISILQTIDRNVYVMNGTTDQTEHNPMFYALWANGMVYVDRRNQFSRESSLDKMSRVIEYGNSVMIFSEGGYNNSEGKLINPLFNGAAKLAHKHNIEIVPLIAFNEFGSDNIYIRASEPVDVTSLDVYEGMAVVRDHLATMLFDIISEHTDVVKREDLGNHAREYYMEVRRQVYECQKWYNDVWDEELTVYSGHNHSTPEEVREFVDTVNVTADNAYVLAPILAQREEDKKYDLKLYLRENVKLHGRK